MGLLLHLNSANDYPWRLYHCWYNRERRVRSIFSVLEICEGYYLSLFDHSQQ